METMKLIFYLYEFIKNKDTMKSKRFRVELDLLFNRSSYMDTPPEELEPDYTLSEIDAFMNEEYCGKPRYYYYTLSITSFISSYYNSEDNVHDITYNQGGKLSFIFELCGKNVEKRGFNLADDFMEKSFGNPDGWSPYEGGIGNEFVVSSRKQYRDMEWEESSEEEDTEEEDTEEEDTEEEEEDEGDYKALGIIDFREEKNIHISPLD
jgi:hypothetical protein